MKTEHFPIENHNNQILMLTSIYQRNDGRVFTKVKIGDKTKQIIRRTESELYTKLYEIYFGRECISLEGLYPEFMKYRRDMKKVTPKTIEENAYSWRRFLIDTDLSKKPLKNSKSKDFIKFFEFITKDATLTYKTVCNLKSLINKMYAYPVREELVDFNPIHSIDFKEFNYYVPNNENKVYIRKKSVYDF